MTTKTTSKIIETNNKDGFKDLASNKLFADKTEFFTYKGIGKDKGTKYSILIDFISDKIKAKPAVISVNSQKLFDASNKYYIREGIKNSKYLSPKFLSEVVRVLNLRGTYKTANEVIKEVTTDNDKGKTSGLLSFDLVKIVK